jgi:hypothetical protein
VFLDGNNNYHDNIEIKLEECLAKFDSVLKISAMLLVDRMCGKVKKTKCNKIKVLNLL